MKYNEKFTGFLVGCHYKKERRGVEWPIEHLEWGGKTQIVKVQKIWVLKNDIAIYTIH